MSEKFIPPNFDANLMRDFDAGLSKIRYELAKNLAEIDVLKADQVENVLSVFNERVVVFQHDFLQMLAQLRGGALNVTKRNLKLEGRHGSYIPGIVGAVMGAGAGGVSSGIIVTTTTSGWWFWSSTTAVSLSSFIAGITGLSAGVVTRGLAVGGGIAGAIAVNKGVSGLMRKRIRKRIMSSFEGVLVPELTNWAQAQINE